MNLRCSVYGCKYPKRDSFSDARSDGEATNKNMVRAPAPVRSSLSHHKPLTYAFSHALQADDELPKPEEIEVEFQDLCTHAPDGRIKTLHPAH